MLVLAVAFAVLGAASNAAGTAFQRKAAATVPRGGGLRLLLALVRKPAWLIGIAAVTVAAVSQAVALANGPLSLVQPVFILELPFALLIGTLLLHRRLPAAAWWAVAAVVAGLALALFAASPSGERDLAPMSRWIPVLIACLGAMAVAVAVSVRRRSGLLRAAILGTASAVGNALTAALLKTSTHNLVEDGLTAFLTTWQTYGFALCGIAAVLLLENALQAGSLAACQPALTIGDATVSLVLGVFLFGESIRLGWWLIPACAGLLLVLGGVLVLTRSVPDARDLAG
ncbi:DMT family transporter [Streptomyces sp. 184]|uniref:DMT family transporter n=1 Tax=Streptomyces sp. 184 TaxID=1827526 RepID=UPI003892B621